MKARIPVSLIVARAQNGVIGQQGNMPWTQRGDLRYFRNQTLGKPLIMGRKTFESIGAALPGRYNIVVTRQPALAAGGIFLCATPDAALEAAQSWWERASESPAEAEPAPEIMIIGGATLYASFLPDADRIYLTEIQANPPGDTFFPELDPAVWRLARQEDHPADAKNQYPYSFQVFERRLFA